jgi:transposase
MVIHFNRIGARLDARIEAAPVRRKIATALNMEDEVSLDFEGVQLVSPSFADECFGKLTQYFPTSSIRKNITFLNASPLIEVIFDRSLKQHMQSDIGQVAGKAQV